MHHALAITHTLPATLQGVRKAKRLSQLALALRLGVSQRHVSFVESGRAKPSRDLLITWLQELDAPLAQRNAAMLQAGFAPIYAQQTLQDPAMHSAHAAIMHLLDGHDPMPAFAIDAHWNLLHLNRGGRWLAATLMPWAVDLLASGAPFNMLDGFCHPEGLTKHLLNLDEVGPTFLAHLREDAALQPSLAPKVEAFASLLRSKLGTHKLHSGLPRQMAPVLTSRFASPHGELAFFSMFTTFGTPQDITLASLRVEHMFAANAQTKVALVAALTQELEQCGQQKSPAN